jgi:uncharacterized phage protein (TIGR01671 family)
MSREIKFRAWDSFTKKWIATGFHILGEVNCFHIIDSELDKTKNPAYEENGHYSTLLRLNDAVITQFTGFTDKSGKEIYEGDIVKYGKDCYDIDKPEGEEHYIREMINEVVFERGEFQHKDNSFGYEGEDLIPLDMCEIIGNIYENPELLT